MASLASACRHTARRAGRRLSQDVAVRGFRTTTSHLAASNFTMPALSPTMVEGNIASWRVKEGEAFSAGDVLLEIETDKATMDVEAQEDGIMFKIFAQDGAKSVAVGTRIGVLAEEGDDISSMEVPADDAKTAGNETKKPQEVKEVSAEERAEKNEAKTPLEAQQKTLKQDEDAKESGNKTVKMAQKQTRPLFPSVQQLLLANNIDKSKVDEMTPTGPNGRLLKGDVLVYLGKVKAETAQGLKTKYDKLASLDFSNIREQPLSKAPKTAEAEAAATKNDAETPTKTPDLQISLPISLAAVLAAQQKVQTTLGVSIPLATFINRATDVANESLPLPAGTQPSANELFNAVLGLHKVGPKGSRGHYVPQLSALPSPSSSSSPSTAAQTLVKRRQQADIFDMLTSSGSKSRKVVPKSSSSAMPAMMPDVNVFNIRAPKAEEKRAKVFLERLKYVLETEPARLAI